MKAETILIQASTPIASPSYPRGPVYMDAVVEIEEREKQMLTEQQADGGFALVLGLPRLPA